MSFLSQPITIQSIFRKDRTIGSITVNVVIKEDTTDTLTITKQPVQQGASITDHSFKEPTVLTMTAYFQDNDLGDALSNVFSGGNIKSAFTSGAGLDKVYKSLLDLQTERQPFTVFTPKRIYKSMLMASLSQTTDKFTENTLSVSMTFQEDIFVSTKPTTVNAVLQNPGSNRATQKAGNKSALKNTGEALGFKSPGFHQ